MTGYGDNFVTGFVSGGKQMLTSNNLKKLTIIQDKKYYLE
jgi:hypothetical protein